MDDDTLSSDDVICSISTAYGFTEDQLNALNKNVDISGFTSDDSCVVNATLTAVW